VCPTGIQLAVMIADGGHRARISGYRGAVAAITPKTKPKSDWTKPTRRRVQAIRDRLRMVYGIPQMAPHGDPIAELVLTVLSQSTNDRNRDVAYLQLRERFPTWEAVMGAPVGEIEEAIRKGGISKVKSARIKAILQAIATGGGPRAKGGRPSSPDLSLDWLPDVPLVQARDYLTALPGVGRKTAACVLLFAYGLHDVPVDTHVSRVGMRLGLLRKGAPFEELHDEMLALTPLGAACEPAAPRPQNLPRAQTRLP
jgi:endonuclease-3